MNSQPYSPTVSERLISRAWCRAMAAVCAFVVAVTPSTTGALFHESTTMAGKQQNSKMALMAKVISGEQSSRSMGGGHIRVERGIRDSFLWPTGEFSKYEAWHDVLMTVRYAEEPELVLIKNRRLICHRGEALKSLSTWADRWSWDPCKVKRFFGQLKRAGMVETTNERVTLRVKVLDFGLYNGSMDAGFEPTNEEKARPGYSPTSDPHPDPVKASGSKELQNPVTRDQSHLRPGTRLQKDKDKGEETGRQYGVDNTLHRNAGRSDENALDSQDSAGVGNEGGAECLRQYIEDTIQGKHRKSEPSTQAKSEARAEANDEEDMLTGFAELKRSWNANCYQGRECRDGDFYAEVWRWYQRFLAGDIDANPHGMTHNDLIEIVCEYGAMIQRAADGSRTAPGRYGFVNFWLKDHWQRFVSFQQKADYRIEGAA